MGEQKTAQHPLTGVLTSGEAVTHELDVPGNVISKVSVTNQRCILWAKDRKRIIEFPRNQLSSMDYEVSSMVPLAILMFLGALIAFVLTGDAQEQDVKTLLMIGAVACLVIGVILLHEVQRLRFWVTGRSQPIVLRQTRYVWQPVKHTLMSLLTQLRSLT